MKGESTKSCRICSQACKGARNSRYAWDEAESQGPFCGNIGNPGWQISSYRRYDPGAFIGVMLVASLYDCGTPMCTWSIGTLHGFDTTYIQTCTAFDDSYTPPIYRGRTLMTLDPNHIPFFRCVSCHPL